VSHTSVIASSTAAGSDAARPFVCTSKAGPRAAWIKAAGELNFSASLQLGQTLREAQLSASLLVLDLRELTFIEASGVAVILDAARQAQLVGRRLMLVRGPVQVDRPLALAGAANRLLIFDLDADEPSAGLLDAA
jgi:anti-anti-sigma factor